MGINLAPAIAFWVIYTYLITASLHKLALPLSQRLMINSVGLVILAISCVMSGKIADKIGKARLLIIGFAGLFIATPALFFWSIHSLALVPTVVMMIIFSIILGMIFGPISAFVVETNRHAWRHSTVSIGYNLAASIFGGTAPLIIAWLTHTTGSSYIAAGYLMLTAVISLVIVWRVVKNPFTLSLSSLK